jgi:hypothetical protein
VTAVAGTAGDTAPGEGTAEGIENRVVALVEGTVVDVVDLDEIRMYFAAEIDFGASRWLLGAQTMDTSFADLGRVGTAGRGYLAGKRSAVD